MANNASIIVPQSLGIHCIHCNKQYASVGDYPAEELPELVDAAFTNTLECDECIENTFYQARFNSGMTICCQGCKGKTTLEEILSDIVRYDHSDGVVQIMEKLGEGKFLCTKCEFTPPTLLEKETKPILSTVRVQARSKKTPTMWLQEATGCSKGEATRLASELRQSLDAFGVRGTHYGVAIVCPLEAEQLRNSGEVYVSPMGKNGKCFVLVEFKDVDLLQAFYKRLAVAEANLKEALSMPQTNKKPHEDELKLKKHNLFKEIIKAGQGAEPVAPIEDLPLEEKPLKGKPVEKKRLRGDEAEEKAPVEIDLVSEDEEEESVKKNHRQRIQTRGAVRDFLRAMGLSKQMANSVIQSLGKSGGNTYYSLSTGSVVIRMDHPTVCKHVESGLINHHKVSPPFESRKVDVEAGLFTCLVLVEETSTLIPTKEAFLTPIIGEEETNLCVSFLKEHQGEFVNGDNDEVVISVTRDFAIQIKPTEYIRIGGPFLDNTYLLVVQNRTLQDTELGDVCFMECYNQVTSKPLEFLELLNHPELK